MLTALHTLSSPTAITCVVFHMTGLHFTTKNFSNYLLNEYVYLLHQPVTSLITDVLDSESELKMIGVGVTDVWGFSVAAIIVGTEVIYVSTLINMIEYLSWNMKHSHRNAFFH